MALVAIQRCARYCSGASRTVSTSCTTSLSDISPSSIRIEPASFHRAVTASGHGSPARTVATAERTPRSADCRTKAAEAGSSSCASSIPSKTSRPSAISRTILTRSWTDSATDGPTSEIRAPKAPNGISDALRVALTQSTQSPLSSASSKAFFARRVLPVPKPPRIRTPVAPAASASRIVASSLSRPTRGQDVASPEPARSIEDESSGVAPADGCASAPARPACRARERYVAEYVRPVRAAPSMLDRSAHSTNEEAEMVNTQQASKHRKGRSQLGHLCRADPVGAIHGGRRARHAEGGVDRGTRDRGCDQPSGHPAKAGRRSLELGAVVAFAGFTGSRFLGDPSHGRIRRALRAGDRRGVARADRIRLAADGALHRAVRARESSAGALVLAHVQGRSTGG